MEIYNKKYKELDTQMRKENVRLAERIAKVREERSDVLVHYFTEIT